MRTLEIVLVCLSVVCLMAARPFLQPSVSRRWIAAKWICFCLLVLTLAAHLVWEGAHWQIGSAYLGVLFVFLLLLLPRLPRAWRIAIAVPALLLVALACCLSLVLPVFELPAPTGKFAIGTRILTMTDTSRKEDADSSGQHDREMVIQIWYPAQPSHYPRAPYRRRSETSLASSYQSVDWTHSRYDAPAATIDGGFPILLYNPGWNGRRTQDTPLNEELASHGYVVVAIDHPYNSGPVALEDGRVIRPLPSPELSDNATTEEALYALINKEVEKETTDTLFVLAEVEKMNGNQASPLFHRLDVSRIGTLGYSLGGLVAAEAAWREPRIHAVLVLDTPLYGEAGKNGIMQPFMLISEELQPVPPELLARMSFGDRRNTKMDQQDYERQLPLLQRPGNYELEVRGSTHNSFQDAALLSPIPSISNAGDIDPRRMIAILRRYSLAFFNQSLRGVASPLLTAKSSPFSEVKALFSSPAREPLPANP
jgi:dienelactone hydrolase